MVGPDDTTKEVAGRGSRLGFCGMVAGLGVQPFNCCLSSEFHWVTGGIRLFYHVAGSIIVQGGTAMQWGLQERGMGMKVLLYGKVALHVHVSSTISSQHCCSHSHWL